jgi:hypothetical protein
MMIINRTNKAVQSQSHRTENWEGDDWVAVPAELEAAVQAAAPYCNLTLDENGNLTDVIASEKPRDYAAELETLRRRLSETDYKVIKCREYQLMGQNAPYDVSALHQQRQTIRDEINALEVMLTA